MAATFMDLYSKTWQRGFECPCIALHETATVNVRGRKRLMMQ